VKNFPKKQTAGVISLLCVSGLSYLLSKIIPLGMSGEIKHATGYLILAIILLIIGLPSAAVYQMYRKVPEADPELDKMRMEMNALSQKAQMIRDAEQSADNEQSKRSANT
jgi:hypothetical protein